MELTQLNMDQISTNQLDKMKHALGIGRKSKPYRNYYSLSTPDRDWEDLIEKGFAKKYKNINGGLYVVYYVTYEATKLIYGKRISKKYYDEL